MAFCRKWMKIRLLKVDSITKTTCGLPRIALDFVRKFNNWENSDVRYLEDGGEKERDRSRTSVDWERRYGIKRRSEFDGVRRDEDNDMKPVFDGVRRYTDYQRRPAFHTERRFRDRYERKPWIDRENRDGDYERKSGFERRDSERETTVGQIAKLINVEQENDRGVDDDNASQSNTPKLADMLEAYKDRYPDKIENYYNTKDESVEKLSKMRKNEGGSGRRLKMLELELEDQALRTVMPDKIDADEMLQLLNTDSRKVKAFLLWQRYLGNYRELRATRREERKFKALKDIPSSVQAFAKAHYCPRFLPIIGGRQGGRVHKIYKVALNWNFLPKVVFDCAFEQMYSPREIWCTAKQLYEAIAVNSGFDFPLAPYVCNFDDKGPLAHYLRNHYHMRHLKHPFERKMVEVTHKNYLEIFPKENIVVLSPDAPNDYKYNPDDILVVGAIVDLSNTLAVTRAKAKEEGVRMARIPIKQYIKPKGILKLPLPNMIHFMSTLHGSDGDMRKAVVSSVSNKIVDVYM